MQPSIAVLSEFMSNPQVKLATDTWVAASWDEYIQTIADPAYQTAKSYYFNGRMRIEMSPLGNPHASDHAIVIGAVCLFASQQNIDFTVRDSCTYRKAGCREVQPDISLYVGDTAEVIPWETKLVSLDIYPPPTLAIEISDSSLTDDKGEKRLLYEDLGVMEYWIVDVQQAEILAFAVENRGSRKITRSLVLPGLELSLLEEALQRSRQTNHGKVSAWLLAQFRQLGQ